MESHPVMKWLLLMVLLAIVNCKNLNLLILHTNDMHGRFEETSRRSGVCKNPGKDKTCVGGFARVAHVIREARRMANEGVGRQVLYLDAGDVYTGSSWFSVHHWIIASEFMNLLEPDAMSLGNHEFDDGPEGLMPFLKKSRFPMLCANIDFSNEAALKDAKIGKSLILKVSGFKIGIIGVLTSHTAAISDVGNVTFRDEVETLLEETEVLKSFGVTIFIALGHAGYETDKMIAKLVPLLDIVVGGHTNTFLWNGKEPDIEQAVERYPTVVTQASGKKVLIVQAYAHTKYIGRLNVTFDEAGDLLDYSGQPLLLDNTVPQDEDVLQRLDRFRAPLAALHQEIIGKSKVVLDGSTSSCRIQECNLGNLVADAFVAYFADGFEGPYWTDAPIAIVNGGGIRTSIEPNKRDRGITIGDVSGALPFANEVAAVSLKGEDIIKSLELGIRRDGTTSGGEFLQMSGMHVVYDMSKSAGSRVVSIKVLCSNCSIPTYAPIQKEKVYRVITTEFLLRGGDDHVVLKKRAKNKILAELHDADMLVWYLRRSAFINPAVEDRIVFSPKSKCFVVRSSWFPPVFISLSLLLRYTGYFK